MPERFGVLTFPGLAGLALRELEGCRPASPATLSLPNQDLVTFEAEPGRARGLARLRLVEDCFLMLGPPVPVARRADLARLAAALTAPGVMDGVRRKNDWFGPAKPPRPTYTSFVKQDRDRAVYRREIAEAINARMRALFPRWQQRDPAALEVWGFYVEGRVSLAFRLSDERLRYRSRPPPEREGALRPTIAAAMVFLARPRAGELVVDPMCGTGTLLAECLAYEPHARCAGGDIDAAAAAMSRSRMRGTPAAVAQWDATALPLPDGAVDCILCNLPFGRQYSTRGESRMFYERLLGHWRAKLKPAGRLVLMAADGPGIEAALAGQGLAWRLAAKVQVLGLWARVYEAGAPAFLRAAGGL